jgi:hypothetical protein
MVAGTASDVYNRHSLIAGQRAESEYVGHAQVASMAAYPQVRDICGAARVAAKRRRDDDVFWPRLWAFGQIMTG